MNLSMGRFTVNEPKKSYGPEIKFIFRFKVLQSHFNFISAIRS